MASFQHEFAIFMLETTPSKPFGPDLRDLLSWESDMRKRYVETATSSINLPCYFVRDLTLALIEENLWMMPSERTHSW